MRFVPVVALLVLAAPAMAQDQSSASAAPAKEKKLCRASEASTGSIMPAKRICHTKAEWAQIDRAQTMQNETRQRRDGSAPLRPDAG
jgi:hypothetical protein